jgi:DNA (cytosine-5)-methyltransferase 1
MSRPRLLDLFSGAGGSARGYQQAGFHVTGVDLEPQPRYAGDEFVQADALTYPLDGFAAIHASPPCQAHVQWQGINLVRYGSVPDHPDLIGPIRDRLQAAGVPYVIENVVGAPLRNSILLCGSIFGLGVRRHRLFETNIAMLRPNCRHTGNEVAVYGKLDGRRIWTRADGTQVRVPRTLEEAAAAMGIDWMTWDELREAIPPAYTEFVGGFLRAAVRERAA